MLRFVVRRGISAALLLAGITVLTFFLLNLFSSEVPRRILGEAAGPEQLTLKAQEIGLDRPLVERFIDWAGRAIQGDLGRSWFTGETVVQALGSRLTVTLTLIVCTIVVAGVIAVVLGIASAVRGGWVDKVVQVLGVIGLAVPSFLIALALVTVFAIQLRLLPAIGYVPITTSVTGWMLALLLPVTALAIDIVASIAQQIRGSMVDSLQRDYVRTLRSRGLSNAEIVYKHVLRNAAGPALSVLALKFVGLLSGAVIVEQVFALPGLGQVAVQSTARGDIPLVMGIVIVTAMIVVIVNLVIDIVQVWLNPKVRLS
ncbi:MAG: ABC transporter permease [Cryobacterium sp.]|nr:ABC transporter permease [Cryobacterium sp.]